MPPIDKSLKKLRELAPALNKAADDAGRIIRDVEHLLSDELNVGVKAEVVFRREDEGNDPAAERYDQGRYFSLAYRRVSGDRFRIAVVEELYYTYRDARGTHAEAWETIHEIPWAECPRDLKLESFPELPQLLEELVTKAEAAADSVKKTQEAVKEILGEVKA